jgi:hypothetical protein
MKTNRPCRPLFASATVVCCVALGSAISVTAASASVPRCGPKHARTLKENRYVRVFNGRDDVFACGKRSGKMRRLAPKYDCSSSSACGGLTAVKLARNCVGFAARRGDQFETVSSVASLNLRTGRTIHSYKHGGLSGDGQTNTMVGVGSLLLKSNGSVGWLESVFRSPAPPGEPPGRIEVHRFDSAGHALLDEGQKISRLRRHDSMMLWVNAGKTKSARLN